MRALARLVVDFFVLLVGSLVRGHEATRDAVPPDEWRRANTFLFGAREVSTRFAEFNIAIAGGIGTGKTTAMLALMVSRIDGLIAGGKRFNVFAYTPKADDFYPLLKALYEPMGWSVRLTNPFAEDSWAWDGSSSLTDPPKIDELTAAVIKESKGEQNPFWPQAAQLVLRGVIQSLAETHPGTWTMRHVVACMKDLELMRQVLGRSEHTKHLLTLLSDEQGVTAANLHGTILAHLKNLEVIASLIDGTPDDRRFSIAEAANRPGVIWVFGSDPRYKATIEPWNSVQWELIGNELRIRGKTNLETLIFIDEFTQLGDGAKLPAIKKLLEVGRSNGVRCVIAMQTPAQVVEVWGEREADTILGQCHCLMVFTHADNYGKEYWSKRLGRRRGWERKYSSSRQEGWSRNLGGSPGRSVSGSFTENVSMERYDLELVTPSNIGDLPVGSYELGISGYASLPLSLRKDPGTGFYMPMKWAFHMGPAWIARHVPRIEGFVPYVRTLKPESGYTMEPLEDGEYLYLGLRKPSWATNTPARPTRPKSSQMPAKRLPKKSPKPRSPR